LNKPFSDQFFFPLCNYISADHDVEWYFSRESISENNYPAIRIRFHPPGTITNLFIELEASHLW
jgi:hypothetical protein